MDQQPPAQQQGPSPPSPYSGCTGCVAALGMFTGALYFWILPWLGVEVPRWVIGADVVVFVILMALAALADWAGKDKGKP